MKFVIIPLFFLLVGCANINSSFLTQHTQNSHTVNNCEYTQRDLTVAWNERLYWCER